MWLSQRHRAVPQPQYPRRRSPVLAAAQGEHHGVIGGGVGHLGEVLALRLGAVAAAGRGGWVGVMSCVWVGGGEVYAACLCPLALGGQQRSSTSRPAALPSPYPPMRKMCFSCPVCTASTTLPATPSTALCANPVVTNLGSSGSNAKPGRSCAEGGGRANMAGGWDRR